MTALERLGECLRNPWVVLGSIGIGALVGLRAPRVAAGLAPLGEIYLALLEMCVLPVMITALVSSVARAMSSGVGLRYLRRLVGVLVVGLLLAGAVGVGVGSALEPGTGLGPEQRAAFGAHVLQVEEESIAPEGRSGAGVAGFLRGMVPENVFRAAATGGSLPLVFFCLILGLALGSARNARSATALNVAEAGYEALLKIVTWVMYGLPVGLFCLVADRAATIGGDLVLAMGRFVLSLYLGAVALVVISGLVIWARVGGRPLRTLQAVKGPLLVGLGTSSNLATIPSALNAVSVGLGRDRVGVNLLVPLGANLYLPGSVLYFALAALFVAQLYGATLGWEQYAVIAVGSVFAAIAASDAPGLAGIGTVALVLDPLGLPANVAIILLSVVDPLIEPALTVADVHGNCMAATLVVERGGAEGQGGIARSGVPTAPLGGLAPPEPLAGRA